MQAAMPFDDEVEAEQRRRLREAVRQAGLTLDALWMRYFSLGGQAGEYEVEAYLNNSYSLPVLQRDILAHAANEMIDELPPRARAAYSQDLLPPPPRLSDAGEPSDNDSTNDDRPL
ncbi:hypothetical protein BN1051_00130 [Arthrobacter saudimassiliensis]|uniref:Uncharacterized protein n=1 Tax=Arthrobacter saudimassiliensis TaxID=1461584 RepID=A0A078MKJ5_9MICC|nr:hypothetical protein BN1051_00130 [Arthrobacter saudimassiliensis]